MSENISVTRSRLSISHKLISILLVNGLLNIMLLLVSSKLSYANNIWNFIIGLIILLVNLLFYGKSSSEQKIELLLIVTWELTILVELIYRIVRFDRTPYRILYISDILCFVFFIEMCVKGKIKASNMINLVIIALFVFGTLSSIFNLRDIFDYIHGVMLIIRIWGLYLYSSTTRVTIPRWTKYILEISIVAFILETVSGFNVDFRNGIFGYEYVGGLFQLILVVWLSKAIVANFRSMGRDYLWVKAGIVELIFALREAKVECLLLILWIGVLIFVVKKKQSIKFFLYPILIVAIGIVGWRMIPVFSPKWAYVFNNWSFLEIIAGGISRMFSDSLTMPLGTFLKEENFSIFRYIFGIGFGAAQPPAYYRFLFIEISGLSGFPKSIWLSSLITKYYYNWSETMIFYRGMYDVIIDLGILGAISFVFILINYAYKAFKLCRCKNENSIILGAIGIWEIFYVFYRMMGYNIIVVPLAMMVFGVLLGMIEFQYRAECKKCLYDGGEDENKDNYT